MRLADAKAQKQVRWRVRYADGRLVMRDGSPRQWDTLDKRGVVQIELWHSGALVLSQVRPDSVNGDSLIYRERSTTRFADGHLVALTYLVGWHPSGPYWSYDAETSQVHTTEKLAYGTPKGMFDPIGEG